MNNVKEQERSKILRKRLPVGIGVFRNTTRGRENLRMVEDFSVFFPDRPGMEYGTREVVFPVC